MLENLPEVSSNEELEESSPEAPSKFHTLSVTTQSSSVILQWNYERPESVEPTREVVFKLLKQETRDEWKSIAWTRKTTCMVENLEQNVCYSLKLLALVEDEDKFRVVDESDVFKVRIGVHRNILNNKLFSVQFKSSRPTKPSSVPSRNLK